MRIVLCVSQQGWQSQGANVMATARSQRCPGQAGLAPNGSTRDTAPRNTGFALASPTLQGSSRSLNDEFVSEHSWARAAAGPFAAAPLTLPSCKSDVKAAQIVSLQEVTP